MTNELNIDPVEVTNTRTGDKSTGVFVYDNYGRTFLDDIDKIPDDDIDLIKLILEGEWDEATEDMFADTVNEDRPIYVGAKRYTLSDVYPDEE